MITSAQAAAGDKAAALRAAGVDVETAASTNGRLDLPALLARLAALECNEVLVESGSTLAGAFLAAALVDELVIYCAPTRSEQRARKLSSSAATSLAMNLNSSGSMFALGRDLDDVASRPVQAGRPMLPHREGPGV